jgi:histidinol-phosphate/aromatic aminotransferase/cobyric acid decarboxylase-like protein/imidazoleglycerol phosphate dehydratase HisB
MRALVPTFAEYSWAPSVEELAARAGVDPIEVIRFDANTASWPLPTSRPATIAAALSTINTYPHGGYRKLERAIADYCGVEPECVVLGAGADDLLLLCARTFAGPGDVVNIPTAPTYSLYRIAAELTGASAATDAPEPALTYFCNPANPTGALAPLPDARPLVVDEAYFEYAGGETALSLTTADDGVIVVRTFSKAFGLAGARVGYAIASPGTARLLRSRQAPAPIATTSAALALAALASPPDVSAVIVERERFAAALTKAGYEPLPSHANFLFVPRADADAVAEHLLLTRALAVRRFADGIRITVNEPHENDLLVATLASFGAEAAPVADPAAPTRQARHARVTAETQLRARLNIDGAGTVHVDTGAGLYDHLLEQIGFHAGWDLSLRGNGDPQAGDDHHTAEDAGITLGEALAKALADRRGITRYGSADVPMDEALARVTIDAGGRPWAEISIEPDPGMALHMLTSFATAARIALHVEARGRDSHHTAEAACKAVGRALAQALAISSNVIPSTKGTTT